MKDDFMISWSWMRWAVWQIWARWRHSWAGRCPVANRPQSGSAPSSDGLRPVHLLCLIIILLAKVRIGKHKSDRNRLFFHFVERKYFRRSQNYQLSCTSASDGWWYSNRRILERWKRWGPAFWNSLNFLLYCWPYICQRGSCRQLDGNPIMAGAIDGLRSNSSFRSPTKVLLASMAFSQ